MDMLDLDSGKNFNLNTIKVIAVDKDRSICDRTITGQMVIVSVGVVEEGSFAVNWVTATSGGAVIVSTVGHMVSCKSGERRWFLLRFGLVPDDEKKFVFDIRSFGDFGFPLKDDL